MIQINKLGNKMDALLEGIIDSDTKSEIEKAHSIHVALDLLKIANDIGILTHYKDTQALSELVTMLGELEKFASGALEGLYQRMN
jgi:hypothetical protein